MVYDSLLYMHINISTYVCMYNNCKGGYDRIFNINIIIIIKPVWQWGPCIVTKIYIKRYLPSYMKVMNIKYQKPYMSIQQGQHYILLLFLYNNTWLIVLTSLLYNLIYFTITNYPTTFSVNNLHECVVITLLWIRPGFYILYIHLIYPG